MVTYIDLHPTILEAGPGKGDVPAEYMFIGPCPSMLRPSNKKNEPFGSRTYTVVERLIKGRSVYLTNLVKEPWPVSKRKLPVKLIRYYYPALLEEIKLVKPKRILALGSEAANVLCPGFDELREDHGTLFWNPDIECYVMPTYNFSAVVKQPLLKKFVARDLERFFTVEDPIKPDYRVIKEWPNIPEDADITMDLEWDYQGDDRITKVGMRINRKGKVSIFRDPTKKQLLELRDKLKEAEVTLIGHNFTSDLTRLNRSTGVPWMFRVRDTMVRAHVDGEEFMSLKHLSTYYTDRPGSRAFGTTEDDAYCAEDVYSTEDVEDVLWAKRGDAYILDVLFDLIPWIARMQTSGVYIQRDELAPLLEYQTKLVKKLHKKLMKWGDINWDAPAQVGDILVANGVKLFEKTKKTGQWATGQKILEPIRQLYPPVDDLLNWTEATKYIEFYQSWTEFSTDQFPYLHPQLKMLGTRTGRFSMSEPNLAQVPRIGPAKTVFRSRHKNGKMGLVDLSQAELRVVALLANDKEMVNALLGGDFHADVAASIYGLDIADVSETQRKKSKGVTFGILYGGTDTGLSYNTGAPIGEVRKIKNGIMSRFKNLAKWIATEERQGLKSKYSKTIFDRLRSLLELILEEGENSARRKIINTPIQATASDIILIIMRTMLKEITKRKLKTRWLFGIYDAGLFDIYPGEEEQLSECIQLGFTSVKKSPIGKLPLYKILPFVGDLIIGETWAACEKTNEGYNPIRKFEMSTHAI